MAEPYPHSKQMGDMGSPPSPRPTPQADGDPSSDAGQSPAVAAEHPKGAQAPLPPDHPSRGTIDESGAH